MIAHLLNKHSPPNKCPPRAPQQNVKQVLPLLVHSLI